jgi:hypothetical protein
MNDQLNEKLIEYLESIKETTENGITFASEQIPLVMQEYVSWVFWINSLYLSLWLIAWVVLFTAGIIADRTLLKDREKYADPPPKWIVCIILGVVCSVLSFFIIPEWAGKMIKTQLAPRVIILEKIEHMIK